MPYRKVKYAKSTIKSVPVYEGERIETKVERIVNNNEPITDGAPINYTEKGELNPNYDHRTDRWEIATDNMDVVHRSESAKSAVNPNTISNDTNGDNNISTDTGSASGNTEAN